MFIVFRHAPLPLPRGINRHLNHCTLCFLPRSGFAFFVFTRTAGLILLFVGNFFFSFLKQKEADGAAMPAAAAERGEGDEADMDPEAWLEAQSDINTDLDFDLDLDLEDNDSKGDGDDGEWAEGAFSSPAASLAGDGQIALFLPGATCQCRPLCYLSSAALLLSSKLAEGFPASFPRTFFRFARTSPRDSKRVHVTRGLLS